MILNLEIKTFKEIDDLADQEIKSQWLKSPYGIKVGDAIFLHSEDEYNGDDLECSWFIDLFSGKFINSKDVNLENAEDVYINMKRLP